MLRNLLVLWIYCSRYAGRLKGQLYVACRRLSVCCMSHGHISKTKQDRPIVTVKHGQEVGTAYSVAAFRFFPRHPQRSGFKCFKVCSYINATSCLTLATIHRHCQQNETIISPQSATYDHRNLLLTLIACCVDNTCVLMQKSTNGRLLIAVARFLFSYLLMSTPATSAQRMLKVTNPSYHVCSP